MTRKTAMHMGQLVMTAGVNNTIADDLDFARHVMEALARYSAGDWGDLEKDDRAMNDLALESGNDRILARYNFPGDAGQDICIITEWDRSYTTVLFPSEY